MGEGYVHQGHFFRMSSQDVTNVLPWPRPGCVGREGPQKSTPYPGFKLEFKKTHLKSKNAT